MMTGNLYIVSAPSGAGKSTLVRRILKSDPQVRLSVSHSTRAARSGELDGQDYHFVSVQAFLDKVAGGEFLEWAQVHGNYYGTSRGAVEEALAQGHDVLLEIDWQGARQVRELFPAAVSVFVLPPSLDQLDNRLRDRATDSCETIRRRLAAAREEIDHAPEFDYVIINDDLQDAVSDLLAVLRANRLLYAAQYRRHPSLFAELAG